MTLDDIYALIKLWYLTWLVMKTLEIIGLNTRKIGALLRGGGKHG